jgi:hypothetical protein
MCLFIHSSFNKYLFATCVVPSIILGTGEVTKNKQMHPAVVKGITSLPYPPQMIRKGYCKGKPKRQE